MAEMKLAVLSQWIKIPNDPVVPCSLAPPNARAPLVAQLMPPPRRCRPPPMPAEIAPQVTPPMGPPMGGPQMGTPPMPPPMETAVAPGGARDPRAEANAHVDLFYRAFMHNPEVRCVTDV